MTLITSSIHICCTLNTSRLDLGLANILRQLCKYPHTYCKHSLDRLCIKNSEELSRVNRMLDIHICG